MNLLSRLFGHGGPPPEPDNLRRQLLDAAGDPAALEQLCRRHRDLIRQHFDAWRTVPLAIRDKPEEAETYMHGLVAVAQLFEQRLGDPALMQTLQGPPGTNPIERWLKQLEEAHRLKQALRYREAAQLLSDVLIDVRRLRGSGVATYLPVTLGELGECYFQAGEAAKAIAPTRQALELALRAADADGIFAYLGNLYEIHRYLEQPNEAADYAEQLAAHLERQGQAEDAARYRRQARLVRAGEPRNRVVAEIDGRRYELDEVLQGVEGAVHFLFERNRMTLRPAEELTSRGEKAAEQGRYDEALGLFRDAAKADPFAPQPAYQAAVTLMHLGRVPEAVQEYERTEELAPGWFHCRSEMWLARQILLGRYDLKAFELLRVAEDGGLPPERRLRLLDDGLKQFPDLALLHHQRGRALRDRGQVPQAVEAFHRGLSCAEEADVRTRLLVDLAALLDRGEERRQLLEEAVALGGNLVAQATARIVLAFDS